MSGRGHPREDALRIWSALIGLAFLISLAAGPARAQTPTATISGASIIALDVDGDGLLDTLVANFTVTLSESGQFYVFTSVEVPYADSVFPFRSTGNHTGLNLSQGTQSFSLSLQADVIQAASADGPYRMTIGVMWDAPSGTAACTLCSIGDMVTQTPPWNRSSFVPPAVRMDGPITDQALDLDGDGLFGQLVIRIPLVTVRRVPVRLLGTVVNANTYPNHIFYGTASVGIFVVNLSLDGGNISASQTNGPYSIRIELQEGYDQVTMDTTFHQTHSYNYTDFEPSSVDSNPPLNLAPIAVAGSALAIVAVAAVLTFRRTRRKRGNPPERQVRRNE